jgi:hypothetical protein
MDKKYLLETARAINQADPEIAEEYAQRSNELIAQINESMLNRPDITELVGKDHLNMMKDNHANHVRFIASILKHYNPNVLVETVLWVFRAYRSHGFSSNYWATQLNAWIDILEETLSEESFNQIAPYYEWMQIHIPIFVKSTDADLDAPNSLH